MTCPRHEAPSFREGSIHLFWDSVLGLDWCTVEHDDTVDDCIDRPFGMIEVPAEDEPAIRSMVAAYLAAAAEASKAKSGVQIPTWSVERFFLDDNHRNSYTENGGVFFSEAGAMEAAMEANAVGVASGNLKPAVLTADLSAFQEGTRDGDLSIGENWYVARPASPTIIPASAFTVTGTDTKEPTDG